MRTTNKASRPGIIRAGSLRIAHYQITAAPDRSTLHDVHMDQFGRVLKRKGKDWIPTGQVGTAKH
jgi:hypothetical protein